MYGGNGSSGGAGGAIAAGTALATTGYATTLPALLGSLCLSVAVLVYRGRHQRARGY